MKLQTHSNMLPARNGFPLETDLTHLTDATGANSRMEFPSGYCYEEFSLTVEDRETEITIAEKEGFYLIYCRAGSISLSQCVKVIEAFQSAIIFNRKGKKLVLNLKRNAEHKFCILGFGKTTIENSDQNRFYTRFEEFYFSHFPDPSSFYVGPPYFKLLEKINGLSQISKSGFAGELIMQGAILQIFGFKMEHMMASLSQDSLENGFLSRAEMRALNSVFEYIGNHPELNFSIDILCKKTGLSPSKLQDGFKRIHGRTVIDYIRHVRLEKSMELLKTTDMNISQIVYSIGLTSRSYFSKIFKNKYKFSPKVLQERFRTAV